MLKYAWLSMLSFTGIKLHSYKKEKYNTYNINGNKYRGYFCMKCDDIEHTEQWPIPLFMKFGCKKNMDNSKKENRFIDFDK